jgi:Kef-type K+ transport system membrane component KefB
MLAISCAAVDDLTAWCLLAVITVIARPQSAQIPLAWRFAALVGYLAAIVLVVRPVARRILPQGATPSLGRFGM